MANNELNRFNRFVSSMFDRVGVEPFDFADKSGATFQHTLYMLNRTQSMFRWEGLPDTIPARVLELYLQINGNTCFYEYNGSLYVFVGGLGGEPDVYYRPTIYTISNPALNISRNLKINDDCIVIPNDAMYLGLMPLFSRYASMISETELSMQIAVINSRIISMLSAPDDRSKKSAEKYLEDVKDGKLGVVGSNDFLEGVRAQPYAQTGATNNLTNLVEFMQYTKASWFNEIGLNANYNMKRESLNSSESQLNNDALLPLVDDMLTQRQLGAERVNERFGTSIRVSLASSWEDNEQEIELEHDSKRLENEGGEGNEGNAPAGRDT